MPAPGFRAKVLCICLMALVRAAAVHAQATVDSALPTYKAVEGVSGAIKSVGSDTMNNLMTLWAEGFNRIYPTVQVEIEGKGSSTAPPALIAGTATFGPMSRPMKDSEIDDFQKRYGFKPTELPTAIDMLAVYVNKDNPLESLTLPQVDAIFSRTRKGGMERDIRLWGDLGLGGEWKNHPISLSGRNAASGTYGYFKEHALFGGDFKDSVKELPGSSSVVQAVARDRYAIGYSGVGFRTPDVRPVPIAEEEGGEPIAVEPENALSGEYPLSRFLLVAVNYKPGSTLDPLRREFVRYIYSKQGQQAVIRDGYLPVNAEKAREALLSVNIKPDF
ncbi:MAG: PstS family phosphate ABC transporter substrate-binding protein [Planctomycetota bacterium]